MIALQPLNTGDITPDKDEQEAFKNLLKCSWMHWSTYSTSAKTKSSSQEGGKKFITINPVI